jgi:hypothetical protein
LKAITLIYTRDWIDLTFFYQYDSLGRSVFLSTTCMHAIMDKQAKSMFLTAEQRTALDAICRRRKVDALVWKRARAFILLDKAFRVLPETPNIS